MDWVIKMMCHSIIRLALLSWSNNPSSHDFSALGGLSDGTRVEIEYNGRCVVAEKRDVGLGGSAVNGAFESDRFMVADSPEPRFYQWF